MDITVVDLAHNPSPRYDSEKDILENPISNKDALLLGTMINSNLPPKTESTKKPFSLSFSFNTLRTVGTTAVSSVKSLYSRLLLPLKSTKKHYWDVIMELILAYNVVTTLYFLAYAMPGSAMQVIDFVCWLFFIFDIIITFFTEGVTDKGEITRSFRKISTNYLKSWFLLDVFAIIPLSAGGAAHIEYYFRMVRLLKLPGVLDITDGTGLSYLLTYFKIGKKEKNGKISYSLKIKIVTSFIQIFLTLIFFVYFFGCLWFWFQKTVANYKYSSGDLEVDDHQFQDDYGLTGLSSEHIALKSSYFMLTTMATIGYGDFLPKNVYEMAFMSCVMLFGVTLFAVIMANFNSAIAFYAEANGKNYQIGDLNRWLGSIEKTKGKIDQKLRDNVLEYFTYYFTADKLKGLAKNYWETDDVNEMTEISQDYVKDLPEEIYYKILKGIFEDFLTRFHVYFTKSRFKYDIIPYLQPMKYGKNTYMMKSGGDLEYIIFVVKGNFSVGFELNREFCLINYFTEGRTVIGDYSALTGNPNQFDYYTESITETLVINAEVFTKILNEKYKEDRVKVLEIAVQREFRFKRIMIENRRLAGVLFQQSDDEKKRRESKDYPTKTSTIEYSEDLINQNLSDIEKHHNEINQKSAKILRNLVGMDSIRMNSILKFNEILNSSG